MNSHLYRLVLCCVVLLLSSSTTFAGTVFSSDFASPPLHPELQDADSAYTISGGKISRTSSTGGGDRHYIRTVDTDYFAATNELLYELTFTNQDLTVQFIGAWLGLTQGNPNNEPAFGSLNFRIHSPNVAGGRVDLGFNGGVIAGYEGFGFLTSVGTHRSRIFSNGNVLAFQIDAGDNGSVDIATTIDLSNPIYAGILSALNTESRAFFGASDTVHNFDNFSIIPEPVSGILLATGALGLAVLKRRRAR